MHEKGSPLTSNRYRTTEKILLKAAEHPFISASAIALGTAVGSAEMITNYHPVQAKQPAIEKSGNHQGATHNNRPRNGVMHTESGKTFQVSTPSAEK